MGCRNRRHVISPRAVVAKGHSVKAGARAAGLAWRGLSGGSCGVGEAQANRGEQHFAHLGAAHACGIEGLNIEVEIGSLGCRELGVRDGEPERRGAVFILRGGEITENIVIGASGIESRASDSNSVGHHVREGHAWGQDRVDESGDAAELGGAWSAELGLSL
jgi:hypothetical protein